MNIVQIRALIDEINRHIAELYTYRWRDDDSPKGEFKTASSPL
jgi:hypothetical protein